MTLTPIAAFDLGRWKLFFIMLKKPQTANTGNSGKKSILFLRTSLFNLIYIGLSLSNTVLFYNSTYGRKTCNKELPPYCRLLHLFTNNKLIKSFCLLCNRNYKIRCFTIVKCYCENNLTSYICTCIFKSGCFKCNCRNASSRIGNCYISFIIRTR